jgi:hypothetical protein
MPAHRWSGDDYPKWVKLANNAQRLCAQNKIVTLIGGQDDIIEALRVAVSMARDRRQCTFTSNLDRGQIPTGRVYWAIGYSERGSSSSAFIEVNARERRIVTPLQTLQFDDPDLYEQWVEAMSKRGEMGLINAHGSTIRALCEAFEKRSDPHLNVDTPSNVIDSFYEVHGARVNSQIEGALAVHVRASPRILGALKREIHDKQIPRWYALKIAAIQQVSASEVAFMIAWLLEKRTDLDGENLPAADWTLLQRIGVEANAPILAFWASAFLGKKADEGRIRALDSMNGEQFKQALKKSGTIPPQAYVGRANAQNDTLKRLERIVKKTPDAASAFKEAVAARTAPRTGTLTKDRDR